MQFSVWHAHSLAHLQNVDYVECTLGMESHLEEMLAICSILLNLISITNIYYILLVMNTNQLHC